MQNPFTPPRRRAISDVLIVLAVGAAAAVCAVTVATGGAIPPLAPTAREASMPNAALPGAAAAGTTS